MKKILTLSVLTGILLFNSPAFATTHKAQATKTKQSVSKTHKSHDPHGKNGEVTPKSIGAGALSLLIWPGIGQLMNDDNNTDKVLVHAVLGITQVFRIWSCYDAVVDRKGGVWENRI